MPAEKQVTRFGQLHCRMYLGLMEEGYLQSAAVIPLQVSQHQHVPDMTDLPVTLRWPTVVCMH